MAFWSLTNSDFPTNLTFHQFLDIDTELDLHRLWVVSMEHLQRVWHASWERLPFWTPNSVPHCGTCLCSNCWDQIPRSCHVFTWLFTLPCGAGSAVPREGFDLSVIILASLLVFPMLGCRHSLLRPLAIFHVFVKWNAHFQTFLLVNTCQSGDIT